MAQQRQTSQRAENRFFLALVIGVTVALALLMRPFFGAILWALVAALLFAPIYHRLRFALGNRRNLAASISVILIVIVGVAPTFVLGVLIVREVAAIYERVQVGNLDPDRILLQLQQILPRWAERLLDNLGWYDLDQIRERLSGTLANSVQVLAAQALNISQSALGFLIAVGVMLYLSFFLLRDGQMLADRVEHAIPLKPRLRRELLGKIATVIRATIKGSLVVAVLQGTIGGVVFAMLGISGALLWAIAMGFFSLLPAIGTGIVWVPVAIYLFATGAVMKGVILVACGLLIIGMVDNLVRPILVGRDTQMPDYVVFISTLGGLELFGFNGFVVGPVIAALFVAVWQTVIKTRIAHERGDAMPGDDDDPFVLPVAVMHPPPP